MMVKKKSAKKNVFFCFLFHIFLFVLFLFYNWYAICYISRLFKYVIMYIQLKLLTKQRNFKAHTI